MSLTKTPFLSLGSRGSIGKTLTTQKRGSKTLLRRKPIPADPKSEAQLAWRQIYRDAVTAWHALSAEEKEAWRGVCPGLTAYQCFMSSELKYPPPPILIDVGVAAIDRDYILTDGWTRIVIDNPANASGTLHTIKIWANSNISGLIVGTFYLTNENTLKCRDSVFIGNVEAGAERTFPGLSIAVEAGDYIGCYFTAGYLERDTVGYAGLWSKDGEYIDPGDEATYGVLADDTMSLYGIGEAD